jgi:hypothetical protein
VERTPFPGYDWEMTPGWNLPSPRRFHLWDRGLKRGVVAYVNGAWRWRTLNCRRNHSGVRKMLQEATAAAERAYETSGPHARGGQSVAAVLGLS